MKRTYAVGPHICTALHSKKSCPINLFMITLDAHVKKQKSRIYLHSSTYFKEQCIEITIMPQEWGTGPNSLCSLYVS